MRGYFFPLFAVALLMAAPCFGAAPSAQTRTLAVSTAGGEAHQRITLPLDKTLIVELDTSAREVLVSNPELVDAVVKSPRRVYLMAKKAGQTNAFFIDSSGHKILTLDIRVEKDVTDLTDLLRSELPGTSIRAAAINGDVVLTGSVSSSVQVGRAQDIAGHFAGDAAKVVNMLQVTGGEQVMLKVRIAEINREISKQLGIDLTQSSTTILGATAVAASTSNPYGLVGSALSDLSKVTVSNGNLSGTLKALEEVGLVHSLAEPNLVAVSGETAKFLAGGEYPVPSGRDSSGNVSVTFKQYGVGLSFTPVVIGPGRISLQLSSEVSELSNDGSYTYSSSSSDSSTSTSTTIPGLSVRRAETTVELPSGGSFAVAGLMRHTVKQQLNAFPGLKDLPILGALFRSRDFQNSETELVVIVTAYLVKPVQEAKLSTPADGLVEPSDPETLLLGRLNAVYKPGKPPIAPQGEVGYIVK
jgi:pilus assembly protein CpaC